MNDALEKLREIENAYVSEGGTGYFASVVLPIRT